MRDLLVHEVIHVVVSLLVGVFFYYKYKRRELVFLSLGIGIFIDIDHVIDYLIFTDFAHFNIIEFFSRQFFSASRKIYVLFHGWEWPLILFISACLWKKHRPVILTISLTMLTHLLIDELSLAYYSHGHIIAGYSFIFRAMRGFSERAFIHYIF